MNINPPSGRLAPSHKKKSRSSPDWWLMIKKFASHGRSIASFSPSSPFLSRAICKGIDYENARCIIELGAGTGPVTKVLLDNVQPHTKLLIIERDPDFCTRLRTRFPKATIIEGDAAKLDELLAQHGITEVDHVVSGLPMPSIPADIRTAILSSIKRVLAPHGTYRQLSIMPWIYFKMYKKYFETVRSKFVPLNLPPACVYHCKGIKDSLTEEPSA